MGTYREENARPHPERDFLVLRLVPQVRKGETRRAGATTRRRACAESDSRPTFAGDGHQDDGLESSKHTTTRLRYFHFLWIFIDRAFTAAVRHYYWFCRETRQKCLRQNSAAWCLRCTPPLMRSDSVSVIPLLLRTCC